MNFKIDIKDLITAISILLSFLTALVGLIISWRNSKRTIYINSITVSRVKWMDSIRSNVADFCGLTLHYCLTDLAETDKQQITEKIDRLRFLLKLQLNPKDKLYKKIIVKIDLIPTLTNRDKIKKLENELNILTELTQAILDMEWKWIKAESKYGELTKKQKEGILSKYGELRK